MTRFLPGHDGLGSQPRRCASNRSYLQPHIVGERDPAPVCSAPVEARGNHHRFREYDSRNLPSVMLCRKLPRDVVACTRLYRQKRGLSRLRWVLKVSRYRWLADITGWRPLVCHFRGERILSTAPRTFLYSGSAQRYFARLQLPTHLDGSIPTVWTTTAPAVHAR
jgi:hypothetical protein